MSDHYDVIVIGSGAGGGTLTHALAPTGKQILLLERGRWYPRERDNWNSQVVWGELRYRNAGLWTDQNGRQFNPKQHYYVGGNTKVYGAVLFRLRERDFGAVHHVDGVSPAWPLALRRLRALVHARPSSSTRCTASAAPIRSSRRRRRRTRGRPSATSRASSSSPTT